MASQDRILFETRSMELEQLINDKTNGALIIPDHQREYCWKDVKKEKFVDSLLEGLPCPSILIGNMTGTHILTLEDGNQRLTTAQKYKSNEFRSGVGSGRRLYTELTLKEQLLFNMYRVPVVMYRNATEEQRIRIFDWHQNGAPLTPGERYHAHGKTFLVKYIKDTLMTQGAGLHDRAALLWGIRGAPAKDERRKWLKNAVGFVVGIAHGSKYITMHYENIINAPLYGESEESRNLLLEEFDTERVTADLVKILEIYEEVEKCTPGGTNRVWKNRLWDGGFATNHIIHSMQKGHPWELVREKWVEFLTKCKNQIGFYEAFLLDVKTKDRNWKLERWERMYMKLFGYTTSESSSNSASSDDESEGEGEGEDSIYSDEE
jgi:hypothetical protein